MRDAIVMRDATTLTHVKSAHVVLCPTCYVSRTAQCYGPLSLDKQQHGCDKGGATRWEWQ
eukprot:14942-Heterococcus_DN1.PRE.6